MDISKCIICGETCEKTLINTSYFYKCKICGNYSIQHKYTSGSGFTDFIAESVHNIVGYLFEFNRTNDMLNEEDSDDKIEYLPITYDCIKAILSDTRIPSTPMQKADKLLTTFYRLSNRRADVCFGLGTRTGNNGNIYYTGKICKIEKGRSIRIDYPLYISYAQDVHEVNSLFQLLLDLEYMAENKKCYRFLPKGYEQAELLMSSENIVNSELVSKTKHWLEKFPQSLEQYNNALTKYEGEIFERNTLDDMRLSFELLVNAILANSKSLENNIADIGTQLKDCDTSSELRNMCTKIIKYYADFQNNNVKHNDKVNKNEIEYVIELTSVLMKFLIKTIGGTQQ